MPLSPIDIIDPVNFLATRLGITPDPQQTRLLEGAVHRGILNCCRQWGKSTITAAMAVHHAFTRAGSLVLVLSPSARQSSEFVRKASHFLRALGVKPRGDGGNQISLLLPNRSRIVGLPSSESTIRGFSAVSLLLIDEASRVPDELYNAVRPMTAVSNGDIWLLSTPAGRRGFFYQAWMDPSNLWTKISVPATGCPRISPEFLDEERAALGDSLFRQEYLCEFSEDGACLFDASQLLALLRDDIQPLFPHWENRP